MPASESNGEVVLETKHDEKVGSESPNPKRHKLNDSSETNEASTSFSTKENSSDVVVKDENKLEESSSKPSAGFSGFASKSNLTSFSSFASSKPFGTGSGFSSTSGFGKQSADDKPFSGFGDTSTSAPPAFFTANSSTSLGFGSSTSTVADLDNQESTSETGSNVLTNKDFKHSNGEEDENTVLQLRAKLYKLNDSNYLECGVGPLRILDPVDKEAQKSRSRLVMRRETYANGPGTKLILNVRLSSCAALDLQGGKSIRATFVEKDDNKLTTIPYLIRVGDEDMAKELHTQLLSRVQLHDIEKETSK